MADHRSHHSSSTRPRDTRSRSPHRHHHTSHRNRSPRTHHSKHHSSKTNTPQTLPFNSRQITKQDYQNFKSMFALYLDIQKGKVLEDMDDTEVRGRWKSFLGKWNRGELSEGWYDPETLQKAISSESASASRPREDKPTREAAEDEDSDSDDSIGPALPGQEGRGQKMGPRIPRVEDLALKREMDQEDNTARHEDMRYARKADKKEQKAALDELVPRAEAGTRERQLEKKKEVNEKMKSFREKSPGATEVPDTELMGGGDGIEGYKKQKQEFERKKNERELRKEEILRARLAEREERLQEYRSKEEGTMAMLKALAKQRFG